MADTSGDHPFDVKNEDIPDASDIIPMGNTSSQLPPKKVDEGYNSSAQVPFPHKNGRQMQQYPQRKPKDKADSETKMRERLTTWTLILLFTLLIAYIFTRDLMLLGAETIFAGVIFLVFRYYFTREKP